ncbi:hypothetical protein E2320_016237 [Naja naja]|nr:hypothetical protein E2320_016237 [Naja naja]
MIVSLQGKLHILVLFWERWGSQELDWASVSQRKKTFPRGKLVVAPFLTEQEIRAEDYKGEIPMTLKQVIDSKEAEMQTVLCTSTRNKAQGSFGRVAAGKRFTSFHPSSKVFSVQRIPANWLPFLDGSFRSKGESSAEKVILHRKYPVEKGLSRPFLTFVGLLLEIYFIPNRVKALKPLFPWNHNPTLSLVPLVLLDHLLHSHFC